MNRARFAAWALLALACSKEEPVARGPSTNASPVAQHTPAEVEPEVRAAAQHANMDEHYLRALAMRRAAVNGDVKSFVGAAAYIADNDIDSAAPESWKPHAKALRDSAEQARRAKTVDEAAGLLGQLGSRCADCHRALGGPEFTLDEPPPQASGVPNHMARHQWAADRMWDGLIAPSTRIWVKGADVMADARLTAEQVAPATPDVDAIARRVHFQANAARLLPEERWGKAYGEFVATCAVCHEKTGVSANAPRPLK